jgi:hypothetical protein
MATENDDFAAFAASGEVEVGESNLASQQEAPEAKPNRAARRAADAKAAKPAAAKTPTPTPAAADEGDEGGEGGDENDDDDPDGDANRGGEGEDDDKGQEGHLRRLKRERADARKEVRDLKAKVALLDSGGLLARLEALEKGGLPNSQGGGKSADQGKPAPDPTDTEKYPLGHLDPDYMEDKAEWLAEKKATERADAALQRQQATNMEAAEQARVSHILSQVEEIAERGVDLHEDFQEFVVDSGMRGDWDLSQTTFEACHEADHGAQILLDLASDKKEATRVSKLGHLAQIRYVQEKNDEIAKKVTPRRVPRAGEPPQNAARGTNSRVQINPATDNLDDFEKLVEADAKAKR